MVWAAVVALGVVGLALVVVGLRGRRVNDHPICRGCGFDLVGLAGRDDGSTDLGAGQRGGRCPECGRELGGRVRVWARRRRTGAMAVGVAMLLLALGWASALGWSRATSFDWNTVKPTWLLIIETRQPTGNNADAGMQELAARLRSGDLTREQIALLVARILDCQDDDDAVWHASWGDLVQEAFAAGALRDEDLERYARQAMRGMLAPLELGGRRFHYGVRFKRPPRAGSTPVLYLQPVLRSCRIEGVEYSFDTSAVYMPLLAHSAGSVGSSSKLQLPPGEHDWELVWDMNIIDQPSFDEIEPLVSWQETFTGSMTVEGN